MDMARHCCRASMKLWADSDELTPGYWFRAEPGAEVLEGLSPFRKRSTWDADRKPWDPLGEQPTGYSDYSKGENTLGYPGTSDCGDSDAFRAGGIHGVHEPLTTEADGSLACCFPLPPPPAPLPEPAWWYLSASSTGTTTGVIGPAPPFGPPPAGTLAVLAYSHWASVVPADVPTIPGWTLLASLAWPVNFGNLSVWYRLIDGTESWPMPIAFATSQGDFGIGTAIEHHGATVAEAALSPVVFPAPYFDGSALSVPEERYGLLWAVAFNTLEPTVSAANGWTARTSSGGLGIHRPISLLGLIPAGGRPLPTVTGASVSGRSWSVVVTLRRP